MQLHNTIVGNCETIEGEYWISKISRNIARDEEIDKQLNFLGWTVLRFWENDIKKHTDECVKVIEEVIFDTYLCEKL